LERSAVTNAAGNMHGFPAALTSFVGRAAVVDEIADQLGRDRLVTVTGPGVPGRRGWPARWRSRWRAGSRTGCGWRSWRRCGTRRRWRPWWRRRGSGGCSARCRCSRGRSRWFRRHALESAAGDATAQAPQHLLGAPAARHHRRSASQRRCSSAKRGRNPRRHLASRRTAGPDERPRGRHPVTAGQ
jgi:hypothetical protein